MDARLSYALAMPAFLLASCSTIPLEREERDRAILAAVQPCKERYAERLYNTNMMSVYQNGTVRYWFKGDQVGAVEEINRCLTEATKGLKVGPWLTGRLTKSGPTHVATTRAGNEILVPVRVNGILGTMALRSGADFTFISPAYAKRSAVQVLAESPTTTITSGGKSFPVPYARVRAIEVGDAQVEALDVAVHDATSLPEGVDGILGKSFLNNFKMDMDRPAQRLTLGPRPAPGGGGSP
jgi:hypothetical protein